jgi:hypothetical protein
MCPLLRDVLTIHRSLALNVQYWISVIKMVVYQICILSRSKFCILQANLKHSFFKKHENPLKPFIFVQYLNGSISRQICIRNIFRMPEALTQTQRMMVEALLKCKTPHAKVAEEAKCSIAQVKKMSMNWNKYGSVVAPKFRKMGRPLIVTCEMRDVCGYSFFLTA